MSEINMDLNPESYLKSLNDGVYAVDTERRIIYWGPSAERITGWRAQDIMGRRCSDDVLAHVDKDGRRLCGREHCPLHRAMVTGKSSDVPIIAFARHKEGRQVPMRVSVAPVRNDSGKVIGGVETFRDASQELDYQSRKVKIKSKLIFRERFWQRHLYPKLIFHRDRCTGCGLCAKICSVQRIEMNANGPTIPEGNPACIHCARCVSSCPVDAIDFDADWAKWNRLLSKAAAGRGPLASNEFPKSAVYPIEN